MAIAICVFHPDSDVLNGFIGPFKETPTGVQFHFLALFYDTLTRRKEVGEVIATIPDGASLAQVAQLSANAAKAAGAAFNFTIGAVMLPSLSLVTPQ